MHSLSLVGLQCWGCIARQPSAALFAASRSGSLNQGWAGEEGRAMWAGGATFPISTAAQQGIRAPVHPTSDTRSTEVMKQITLGFLCSQWRE